MSGKVGNAVVRNRVRRRLREGLRELLRERPVLSDEATVNERPSCDLLVIARPEAAGAGYGALKQALERALSKASLW